jgi:hypothetical protein
MMKVENMVVGREVFNCAITPSLSRCRSETRLHSLCGGREIHSATAGNWTDLTIQQIDVGPLSCRLDAEDHTFGQKGVFEVDVSMKSCKSFACREQSS